MTPEELKAMTPEQKRIRIAEACGWAWENGYNTRRKQNHLRSPTGKQRCVVWRDGSTGGSLPDYFNDLNIMHIAIMARTAQERSAFSHAVDRYAKTFGKLVIELEASELADLFLLEFSPSANSNKETV